MLRLRSAAPLLALALLVPAPAAQAVDSAQPGATLLLGRPGGFGSLPDDSVNYANGSREKLSKNGRYLAFTSAADGMSSEDNDSVSNVYVRDLQTNTTTLVSRASGVAGAAANNDSYGAVISGDGTKVAFASYATNLGATGGQVYVRDLVANTTTIVSCVNATACTPGGGSAPSINDDGTKISFESRGSTLATDTNSASDIFARNTTAHTTTLVSRATGGGGAQANQDSFASSISDDGNRVVWQTTAAFAPTDSNGKTDVYLRDISGNVTRWVSHSALNVFSDDAAIAGNGGSVAFKTGGALDAVHDTNGAGDVYLWSYTLDSFTLMSRPTGASTNAGNGASYTPAVDTTGSTVAFQTEATNLGDGDTTTTVDVHTRSGTTTSLASRATGAAGAPANGGAGGPSLDDTGAHVAFDSAATNLVPAAGPTDSTRVYVRNPAAQTTVASLPTGPATATFTTATGNDTIALTYAYFGTSSGNAMSEDGRYVTFTSESDSLLGSDDDTIRNVYVRDVLTGQITLVSVSTSGQPADGSSGQASISADGSHVAFESSATNLGAQGMVMSGVYVRDLAAGTTTFASRADGTAGAADTYATGTALSADGTKLSFMASTSLDPKDTNGTSDIYVRDLAHATTTLVSRADGANTNAGNASSLASMINGDGTRVAFVSAASDLGDGDPNNAYDVHLRDLSANTTILVDRADGANGAIADSNTFGVSIDRSGNRVAFDSTASNLATGVPSFSTQVYVRDVAAGTTQLVSHAGSSGAPADDYAYQSRISSDGHQVAFQASGTNLQPPDATHVSGVFLRDLDAQTLQLVSRADGAAGAPATAAANPTLDADGSCVAFTSNDPLTSPGYASHDFSHVYLRVVSRECPLIAPDTTIDSGPTGALSSPSRAITFSSSEAGSTFACKLDGQPYATCSSPYTTPVAGQGAHTFSVRATDKAQLTDPTPATADFTVGPPAAGGAKPPGGGGKDTTAPVVRGLAITPRSFAVAAGTTALAAAKHARRGTTITYTLSERASTTLTISRTLPGRRKGKRCVAAGKAPKHAKRCTRSVVVATLTRTAATGKRRVPFTGRVGKRKLARGSYELIVRARDAAGNVSAPARTTFKVRSR